MNIMSVGAAVGRLRRVRAVAAIFAALLTAVTAVPAAAVDFEGSAEVVTDYRFRGISLSNREPVVEASVEASVSSYFVAVEAISSSRDRGLLQPGHNAEIDLSAGWTHTYGLLTPTAGAIAFFEPGSSAPVNGELFATLAGELGPATLTVGANYAPSQQDAHGGNLYLFAKAEVGIPLTPLTVHASVGREAGGFDGGRIKTDFLGGVEARVFHFVVLGVDYVGNDLPHLPIPALQRRRDDGIVARAGVRF
jgi:uncharacterized protein (TIGR02001 family)